MPLLTFVLLNLKLALVIVPHVRLKQRCVGLWTRWLGKTLPHLWQASSKLNSKSTLWSSAMDSTPRSSDAEQQSAPNTKKIYYEKKRYLMHKKYLLRSKNIHKYWPTELQQSGKMMLSVSVSSVSVAAVSNLILSGMAARNCSARVSTRWSSLDCSSPVPPPVQIQMMICWLQL